jgi:hypothetical protein
MHGSLPNMGILDLPPAQTQPRHERRCQTAIRQLDRRNRSPPPPRDLKVANRELGTIAEIGDGIDPATQPHLDHGYAVTSHSSQGQTAERVLVHVDTELGAKDLLNSRKAYVALSRGALDAQIFTDDRGKLAHALGRDVSHLSAHLPEIAPRQSIEPRQPEIAPTLEHSHGYGLGL